MDGKVWLVGAGPGDAGLFTLKGKEVLAQADVVVYDALVGEGVLAMIPEKAEKIFAGKRSGHHYLKQEETNKVLFEEARKGKKAVRLKGGDPFLFGRGGEELELLAENDIPFEVVPGITSAFAVPAYNGIPVTHRDFCSSVHIITGHKRADHSYDIDFKALVCTKGTLVFLMGIAALHDIVTGLLDAGMDPDIPAAVLEQGTTALQARICAALKDLEAVCAQTTVKTPAIIVVGQVAGLADQFSWYEKLPLGGIRTVVTRPKHQASGLSSMLRKEGAEVLEYPAISIRPVRDMSRLHRAFDALRENKYDWIVFTSPNGVRIFFDELSGAGDRSKSGADKPDTMLDIRILAGVKIASIGKGSEKELNKRGIKADFIPSVYDGVTLGKELSEICGEGARFLIPRAAIGNQELPEMLKKVPGAAVDDIPIYETVYETDHLIDIRSDLENRNIDFAVFTSASTVKGFAESLREMNDREPSDKGCIDLSGVKAVCIGRQTAGQAEKYGMKTFVAEKATLASLVECVKKTAAAGKTISDQSNAAK